MTTSVFIVFFPVIFQVQPQENDNLPFSVLKNKDQVVQTLSLSISLSNVAKRSGKLNTHSRK